jgi:hypothetical protein
MAKKWPKGKRCISSKRIIICYTLGSSQAPYAYLKALQICHQIRGGIHNFLLTQLSFIKESRYSPYCFIWRIATPRIIYSRDKKCMNLCRNLGLSFNTENRDYLYCLIRRVTTPHIAYRGESLLRDRESF